jgi:tetratricopeptide (TPR) repeat protein
MARVAYVRSTLFWTQQRFDEALRSAQDASEQFAAIGDEEGFRRATLAKAILQMRLNDYVAARATFERIYAAAEGDRDDLTKARAGSSLADCLIHMGETGEALRYAIEAEQIFAGHELITEAARMRWIIGYAILVAGNSNDAATRLLAVVSEFDHLQLAGDAALAKLDLVEAYVALERYDEARRLGSEILQYFKAHDMLTGGLTAAAFLEEAARQRRLTRPQVGYVRDYLKRLANEPQLSFLPPV